jgi:Txe/YoeB family toxin of Txe-Axe toxin-antitoxin module
MLETIAANYDNNQPSVSRHCYRSNAMFSISKFWAQLSMNYLVRKFENQLSTPTTQAQDWCVIRQMATMQSLVIGRFSSRIEAEHYRNFMKRIYPHSFFEVIFDAPLG